MPQAPAFAVFQRVTADLLNATTPTLIQKATALPAVVSSTTLVPDGELVGIPLGIGVWDIVFYLYVTADGAITTPPGTPGRITTSWTFSGTATGFRNCLGPGPGNTVANNVDATTFRSSVHGFGTSVPYGAKGTGTFARIEERSGNFTVTAAGNLGIQYAQTVSSAVATTVQAGSYVIYRQIA